MVGLAIGGFLGTVADLSSPTALQEAFDKAHKLLFSTAISIISNPSQNGPPGEARDGLLLDQPTAIILIRTFAIIVEASILLVALLAVLHLFYSWRRPSGLNSDPATSIVDIMSLVRNSKDLSYLFEDNGVNTPKILEQRLLGKCFSIIYSTNGNGLALRVLPGDPIDNVEKENGARKTSTSFSSRDNLD